MRLVSVMVVLLGLSACPRTSPEHADTAGGPQSVATVGDGAAGAKLTVVCSATESDPWTSEIIDTLGAELGFDPWSRPSAAGYLDVLGPYDAELDGRALAVTVCLAGFGGVVDVAGQEALGGEVRSWLLDQQPDLVWLDGDPLQFQVGSHLPADWPIVFSGVVIDRGLYYSGEQRTTGIYQRYSLPRVLREVWRQSPEATRYALLSDDSPISLGRAKRLAELEEALPDGHSFVGAPHIEGWRKLQQAITDLSGRADALIICGVGEEGCSDDFTANPCPADLLAGLELPVIALGPSHIDYSGAISLRLKPSVHAQAALERISRVLRGTDPRAIPVETPEDMAVFSSEAGAEREPSGTATD